MTFKLVIPARYASTRFPGKPLAMISGRSLLQHVHDRALCCGAEEVLVATDDLRIAQAAKDFGAEAVMTSGKHASGTDRVAEVVRLRGWSAATIVVNMQGDEPLLPSVIVIQVAKLLAMHTHADIATLYSSIGNLAELLDPNVVKLVADDSGRALYFSRAPIPFHRDSALAGRPTVFSGARRHIGLYAYRVRALLRLADMPQAALEDVEKLEQLRALAQGFDIRVAEAAETPGPDVNSPEDLARVAALLA